MGTIEGNNNKLNEKEIRIKTILLNKYGEKAKSFFVNEVDNDVFAISSDKINITSYLNSNGEFLLSISSLREKKELGKTFLQQGMLNAGYYEVKDGNRYKLYKRKDMDLDNLKPMKGAIEISQYSAEYFSALQNINFHTIRVYIDRAKNTFNDAPGYYIKFYEGFDNKPDESFYEYLNLGVIRIEDLEFFVKDEKMKNRQITKEMFEDSIKKMKDILPKQCLDTRFTRMEYMEGKIFELESLIDLKDLEGYIARGRIDKQTFDICKTNIEKRDKLLQKNNNDKRIVKMKTKDKLEEERKKQEELRKIIMEIIEK